MITKPYVGGGAGQQSVHDVAAEATDELSLFVYDNVQQQQTAATAVNYHDCDNSVRPTSQLLYNHHQQQQQHQQRGFSHLQQLSLIHI